MADPKDLRQYFKEMDQNADALQETVRQLEAAFSRRVQAEGWTPDDASQARSALDRLTLQMEGLHTPRFQQGPGFFQTDIHPRSGGLLRDEDIRDYVHSLWDRLRALHDLVPQIERDLALGARRAQRRQVDDLKDLRVHVHSMWDRLQVLEDLVPRLEGVLAANAAGVGAAPIPMPLPPVERRRKDGGPIVIGTVVAPVTAALFSHRRLQSLLPLVAALVALLAFGAAAWWNDDWQKQAYAKQTVTHMQNAPSYRANGTDVIQQRNMVLQIQESYAYVGPSSINTRYLTAARNPGTGSAITVACADKNITILSSTRYQKCNSTLQNWNVDSYNPQIFTTSLFQPWMRFSWCLRIKEVGQKDLNGVPTTVFTCPVPPDREAGVIWESVVTDLMKQLGMKPPSSQQDFIQKAKIELEVWVRNSDGYIGLFRMNKTYPEGDEIVTETVQYQYYDFGKVPDIVPPSIEGTDSSGSGAGAGSGSQTGTGTGAGGGTGAGSGTKAGDTGAEISPDGIPWSEVRSLIVRGNQFNVEIAISPEDRARGLSSRNSLPLEEGMLFVLPVEAQWQFWAKDMRFPVDLIYINRSGTITDIYYMPVEDSSTSDSNLTLYTSTSPVLYAFEINGGLAGKLGLQPGMKVQFSQDPRPPRA